MASDASTILVTGRNNKGQLGLGHTNDPVKTWSELAVPGRVQEVVFGELHGMILLEAGTVYTSGRNNEGQLGLGDTNDRSSFTQVGGALEGKNVVKIACGSNHSGALTDAGELYLWGNGDRGQIGDGATSNRTTPTLVAGGALGDGDGRIAAFDLGYKHTVALTQDRRVLSWGNNVVGELGGDGVHGALQA